MNNPIKNHTSDEFMLTYENNYVNVYGEFDVIIEYGETSDSYILVNENDNPIYIAYGTEEKPVVFNRKEDANKFIKNNMEPEDSKNINIEYINSVFFENGIYKLKKRKSNYKTLSEFDIKTIKSGTIHNVFILEHKYNKGTSFISLDPNLGIGIPIFNSYIEANYFLSKTNFRSNVIAVSRKNYSINKEVGNGYLLTAKPNVIPDSFKTKTIKKDKKKEA